MHIIFDNGLYLVIPDNDVDIERINYILFQIYRPGVTTTKFKSNNGRSVIPVFYSQEDAQHFVDLVISKFAKLAYIKSKDFLITSFELDAAKMIYECIIRLSKTYEPPTQT